MTNLENITRLRVLLNNKEKEVADIEFKLESLKEEIEYLNEMFRWYRNEHIIEQASS